MTPTLFGATLFVLFALIGVIAIFVFVIGFAVYPIFFPDPNK